MDIGPGPGQGFDDRWPESDAAACAAFTSVQVIAAPIHPDAEILGLPTYHQPISCGTPHHKYDPVPRGRGWRGPARGPDDLAPDSGGPWASRASVHQATGMVIAEPQIGGSRALALLRAHASAHGQALTEVAQSALRGRLNLALADEDIDPDTEGAPRRSSRKKTSHDVIRSASDPRRCLLLRARRHRRVGTLPHRRAGSAGRGRWGAVGQVGHRPAGSSDHHLHRAIDLEVYQAQQHTGPCADAVDTGEYVFASGAPDIATRWPGLTASLSVTSYQAVQAHPMRWHGHVLGAITFFFAEPVAESRDQLVVGQAFADMATLILLTPHEIGGSEIAT